MLRFRLAAASSLVASIATCIGACVGDDPSTATTPPADASTSPADATTPEDGATRDSSSDAAEPRCHVEDPFDPPVELANVNDLNPTHPRLTSDELEMFFQSRKDKRIYVARRGSSAVAFDPPQLLNTTVGDAAATAQDPSISGDGKTLFFSLDSQLAKMERSDRVSPFGAPSLIGLDDPAGVEEDPHILPDKSVIYFERRFPDGGAGPTKLFRAVSGTAGFSSPTEIVVPGRPIHPSASDDDLTLYYTDTTDDQIHRMTRASTAQTFGTPAVVPELSISADGGGLDRAGWLSPDGCRMYMAAGGLQTSKLYLATKKPR